MISDGNYAVCSHTSWPLEGPGAWWVVDLGAVYSVARVSLTNRNGKRTNSQIGQVSADLCSVAV